MCQPPQPKATPTLAVVFPTRNNAGEIRDHLKHAAQWIDLADEIIVIDSSDDETPEICRRELPAKATIVSHPPGLYASWNAAMQRVRSEYLYISTVGDHIEPQLLARMLQLIDGLSLDLIITPPKLRGSKTITKWPIHHLIRDYQIEQLTVIEPQHANLLNFCSLSKCGLSSLTGSFASNIVRSGVLQAHPFPTRYGGFGDVMWFAAICGQIRMGILPECASTFMLHPSNHATFAPHHLHDCFMEALTQQIQALSLGGNAYPYKQVERFHSIKMALKELRHAKPHFYQSMLQKAALSLTKKYFNCLSALQLANANRQLRGLLRPFAKNSIRTEPAGDP